MKVWEDEVQKKSTGLVEGKVRGNRTGDKGKSCFQKVYGIEGGKKNVFWGGRGWVGLMAGSGSKRAKQKPKQQKDPKKNLTVF